jgi:4'-phosphopantetheinyl transferase
MTERLGDDLHVWLCDVDQVRDQRTLDTLAGWLDATETRRWSRFLAERDRHLFLVAHALVRRTLSLYADVPPAAWRFALGPHGRPEITSETAGGSLRFNLSHTRGLAAVLVHPEIDCGVDVEARQRKVDYLSVSRRVFSDTERKAMLELPEAEQKDRFFQYWTLKESYIKARGMGLSLPLEKFAFGVEGPIRIDIDASLDDDPEDWQFETEMPTPEHQLSVAARRGRGQAPRKLSIRWMDLAARTRL